MSLPRKSVEKTNSRPFREPITGPENFASRLEGRVAGTFDRPGIGRVAKIIAFPRGGSGRGNGPPRLMTQKKSQLSVAEKASETGRKRRDESRAGVFLFIRFARLFGYQSRTDSQPEKKFEKYRLSDLSENVIFVIPSILGYFIQKKNTRIA